MAERRRRSVYRTSTIAAEDDGNEDHSPGKVIVDNTTTSPSSGFKRPRNASNVGKSGRHSEVEHAKDEKARKVRHTISGSEKSSAKPDNEHEQENSSRPSKQRRTVDFSQERVDKASEAAKAEDKSKSRKSTTRQSGSALVATESNATSRERETRPASAKVVSPQPKPAGKGKGRAADPMPREPIHASSDHARLSTTEVSSSKGKGKAKAAPKVPDYEGPADSSRLHDEVPTDMPEPRRLQRLLELAVEAEQAQMSRLYTGECSWISRCAFTCPVLPRSIPSYHPPIAPP
jgi:hypothetical protein